MKRRKGNTAVGGGFFLTGGEAITIPAKKHRLQTDLEGNAGKLVKGD